MNYQSRRQIYQKNCQNVTTSNFWKRIIMKNQLIHSVQKYRVLSLKKLYIKLRIIQFMINLIQHFSIVIRKLFLMSLFHKSHQQCDIEDQQVKSKIYNQNLSFILISYQIILSTNGWTVNLKLKSYGFGENKEIMRINLMKKIRSNFLFIINLSNQIYHDLDVQEYKPCLKFYVGPGNNSNLIKSVFKKRFWFVETNNYKEANFVWTQIKIPEIFSMQQSNRRQLKYLQISEQINERKIKSSTTKRILRFDETDSLLKLLNYSSYQYYKKLRTILDHHKNDFKSKIKYLNKQIQIKMSFDGKIHNHLPSNGILGNKKAMFYSLRQFYRLTKRDVFTIVPLTFHIQNGVKDDQFKTFLTHFNEKKKNKKPNIWIIKPGQNTNRGNGIECTNKLEYIKKIIDKKIEVQNEQRTFIIQSYINKPFLYQKRKFDIRTYMLITINNGILKGYWYQQGYVRTSSHYFNLEELTDQMIHLTNDAIQKNGDDYGRFEPGNKLSYYQLQRYLDSCGHKVDFHNDINPIMKKIAAQSIKSTFLFLDKQKKVNNFELFGLDYMIDEKFKPWLIQINTNPCLELSCGVLQRIIPHLIENTFRIGLDPIFAPPNIFPPTKKYNVSENALFYNKFELIFDEIRDGLELIELYNGSKINQLIQNSDENQELYENDGEIIQIPQ